MDWEGAIDVVWLRMGRSRERNAKMVAVVRCIFAAGLMNVVGLFSGVEFDCFVCGGTVRMIDELFEVRSTRCWRSKHQREEVFSTGSSLSGIDCENERGC